MSDIQGRKVLITGAGAGMGLLMAERFAREGDEPILVDVNEAALKDATARIGKTGAPVHGYRANLANEDEITALRAKVAKEVGPIDILVNNAGVVTAASTRRSRPRATA